MAGIIRFLTGIWGVLVGIFAFLKSWYFNFVAKYATLGSTILINTFIFSAFIGYFTVMAKLILFVYDKVNYFIAYLNNLQTANSIFNIVIHMLASIGFLEALNDVFMIFYPAFGFMFFAIASIFVIRSLIFFRSSLISVVIAKL